MDDCRDKCHLANIYRRFDKWTEISPLELGFDILGPPEIAQKSTEVLVVEVLGGNW
jgi:hypothetical protein